MNLYIHEWPDSSATLMLDNGESMYTFTSVARAIEACDEWYRNYGQIVVQRNTTQDLSCSTLC
jgi:hypothetical protein